jgi:hypothetical protein
MMRGITTQTGQNKDGRNGSYVNEGKDEAREREGINIIILMMEVGKGNLRCGNERVGDGVNKISGNKT